MCRSVQWAIDQRLREVSEDALQVSDGSLNPALHKLEQQGWISAEWRSTENKRRAKVYALTPPGRRYPRQESENRERLSQASRTSFTRVAARPCEERQPLRSGACMLCA